MPAPTPARPGQRAAVALMVCAALMWSIAGVITRHLESVSSFEATFWRSVFAGGTVLAGLALSHRGGAWRSIVASGRPGLLAGACFAIMYACFMVALTITTVANTLLVSSLAPLFTALLAWAAMGERVPVRTWVAIVVAFAGMAWMFAPVLSADESHHALGMAIALGVPLAAAVNDVTLSHAGPRFNLVPAVLLGAVGSALVMLPAAWPLTASAHDLALLALLGVVQLGLPCMMLVVAARTLSAPEVALLGLIEVVAGPVWAWLGAGERPSAETLSGGAVVLAALAGNEFLALRRRRRP